MKIKDIRDNLQLKVWYRVFDFAGLNFQYSSLIYCGRIYLKNDKFEIFYRN